ncbi:hypothetical protein D3C71_724780 [compost metagenome]
MEHGAESLLQELHVGIVRQIPAHLLTYPQIEAMLDLEWRLPRRIRAQGHLDTHRLFELGADDPRQIGQGSVADQMALLGFKHQGHQLPLPGHHRVDGKLAQPATDPGAGDELGPSVTAIDQQGRRDQASDLLPLLRLGVALQLIPVDGLHHLGSRGLRVVGHSIFRHIQRRRNRRCRYSGDGSSGSPGGCAVQIPGGQVIRGGIGPLRCTGRWRRRLRCGGTGRPVAEALTQILFVVAAAVVIGLEGGQILIARHAPGIGGRRSGLPSRHRGRCRHWLHGGSRHGRRRFARRRPGRGRDGRSPGVAPQPAAQQIALAQQALHAGGRRGGSFGFRGYGRSLRR